MRRGLSLVMAAVLLFMIGFTGCGGNAAPNSSGQTPAGTPAPNSSAPPPQEPTPVTWTPQTSTLPAPPAIEPPPGPASPFPLTVSSPSNGATVNSPAHVVAQASPSNPILYMRVYVDGQAVFLTFFANMDALIWMAPGSHTLEILAEDKKGFISDTSLQVNVVPPQAPGVDNIQSMGGWQSCSAVFPPSSARAGQICAAGLGTAVSTMTPNQGSPSLDGQSAKFTLAGPAPYSNELWFNPLGGGSNVSHFVYDLDFYIDNPAAPQALEFDVNQTFGGQRWTWGTECNFNGSGKWDIWDPLNEKWVPTQVDCKPFPANTWIHLVWTFERVNGQTHYISIAVNDVTTSINQFFQPQPQWTLEDIDVAFQMDGNFQQQPYTVWLDKVTLQAN
jgi:hypothetical protein